MRNIPELGIQIPEILVPAKGIDLQKWAVIACDQYTSEPEYWAKVSEIIGSSPSTLNMIFPEVFLGKEDETTRIQNIHAAMHSALQSGIFESHTGFIYVERMIDGKIRRGLMMALDLEHYDFNKGSQTPIRATEGTILDRLPPRIKIRENAPVEFPHILMLIDDPQDCVIGTVEKLKNDLPITYDFNLMFSSGHLTGRLINNPAIEEEIIQNLRNLTDEKSFLEKYDLPVGTPLLLFASGDGNHSLATAKSCWEKLKPFVGMDHPARYALVEVENVHDKALEFEPIHRVLFNERADLLQGFMDYYGDQIDFQQLDSTAAMIEKVDQAKGPDHHFGLITNKNFYFVTINQPKLNLPVGSLQEFLDSWMKAGGAEQIDYVHGSESLCELSERKGNAGFYLAGMPKGDLFKTVIKDGSLPRKTFSMGEAHEKRFYLEARRISSER